MDITEVRIKLTEESEDRLRAFCSITFDDSFVIRDLKIIEGSNGSFVAMPSRKLTGHCHRCRYKNQIRANYCNHCGAKQKPVIKNPGDSSGKLYADVAHPINSECRELIQNAVLKEFEAELERYQEPGYRSRYDDEFSTELPASNKIDPPQSDLPRPHLPDEPVAQTDSNQNRKELPPKANDHAADDIDLILTPKDPPNVAPTQEPSSRERDSIDDGFGKGIF